MSSARRIAASRANGNKSQGLVTPDGKARSSGNATLYGLAAPGLTQQPVCPNNENRAEFIQLREARIPGYAPATSTENLIVQEMAVARRRLQRAWVMETALLDNQMDHIGGIAPTYESTHQSTRFALGFRKLIDEPFSFPVLPPYEVRLSSRFDLCLSLQGRAQNKKLENEPNPKNEHHTIN